MEIVIVFRACSHAPYALVIRFGQLVWSIFNLETLDVESSKKSTAHSTGKKEGKSGKEK
jgi:hypothetical protein